MRRLIKRVLLHLFKWLGLFAMARYLTGAGLRILCYHGLATADQGRFLPQVFMEPGTFRKRLQYLRDGRFPVLALAPALELLYQGKLPLCATVITIDDGWFSTYHAAAPLLEQFSFPATIYVTTYYVLKQRPVFRQAIHYMFWKSGRQNVDVGGLVSQVSPQRRYQVMEEIIAHGQSLPSQAERCALAAAVGERLGVDYAALERDRSLSLMSVEEIRDLAHRGFDIQLHTHRHRFPADNSRAAAEISDNRQVLEPVVGRTLRHFCYPMGNWSVAQFCTLTAAGVASATTCERGLNYRHVPSLSLRRIIDGNEISQIEFEAIMCGFDALLRPVIQWCRRWGILAAPQSDEQH